MLRNFLKSFSRHVRRLHKTDSPSFPKVPPMKLDLNSSSAKWIQVVHRKRWKNFIIEEMNDKMALEPVGLPKDLSECRFMEYQHVKIRGTFDHTREQHIILRSLIDQENPSISRSPFATGGVYIVTPFKLADRNVWILVNRGWVSKGNADSSKRSSGQIEGEVELGGIVRLNEKGNFTVRNKNRPDAGEWLWRDIDSMAYNLKTAPVFIDADKASTVPGGPVGGQTRVTIKDDHVLYVATWWTLAAITGWMWASRYVMWHPENLSALNKYRKGTFKIATKTSGGNI